MKSSKMELQRSQEKTEIALSTPSTVLREQPSGEAIKAIADKLDILAKLYQVPNWDQLNAILLAEWIMDEYHSDMLKTVMDCLNRPRTSGKTWRLTPDTIKEWMSAEQDKLADRREKYIHNKKVEELAQAPEEELSEETQKLINDYQEKLLAGLSKPVPITENDIHREGQKNPVKKVPVLPMSEVDMQIRDIANRYGITVEQVKDIRFEWMRECFDKYTGNPKPNYLSFEEWLLK